MPINSPYLTSSFCKVGVNLRLASCYVAISFFFSFFYLIIIIKCGFNLLTHILFVCLLVFISNSSWLWLCHLDVIWIRAGLRVASKISVALWLRSYWITPFNVFSVLFISWLIQNQNQQCKEIWSIFLLRILAKSGGFFK